MVSTAAALALLTSLASMKDSPVASLLKRMRVFSLELREAAREFAETGDDVRPNELAEALPLPRPHRARSTPPAREMTDVRARQLQGARGATRPTVVLALEGVLVDTGVPWDARYGRRIAVRPGAEALLLALSDVDAEVVLWSSSFPSGVAADLLVGPLVEAVAAVDARRWRAFCDATDARAAVRTSMELVAARQEGENATC